MPWRGPEYPGEFPSLGWEIVDWIETYCVIPDGENQGKPYVLTDEMVNWLVWFYRLRPEATGDRMNPSAAWVYRRGQLVRPQKWGKGPFASSQICAEAKGPVLFDGWDANGEPVGRPWATPWIQVTACAEGQTANIWRALQPMIELGPLADVIEDTGLSRINLGRGGYIEPVTSSSGSRLGQRLTFDVHDETQNWFAVNGGKKLAQTKRRNLAGMQGRSIETTNTWDPAESSVAQDTWESPSQDILRDNIQPEPLDTADPANRRKIMEQVYCDSARSAPDGRWQAWVQLDRIDAEWVELAEVDRPQADRFFCNVIGIGSGAAFDIKRWQHLARPGTVIPAKDWITVGFDGSKFHDHTAMIATHVESGYQWPLGIWRPEDFDDGEIDEAVVTAALTVAFDTWRVFGVYCDPPYWEEITKKWAAKWGPKRIVDWWTNRDKAMAYALRSYQSGINGADGLTHCGADDELGALFTEHIRNARRRPTNVKDDDGRPMYLLRKEHPKSPLKIDAAMAGCLSWEARMAALAAGVLKPRSRAVAF